VRVVGICGGLLQPPSSGRRLHLRLKQLARQLAALAGRAQQLAVSPLQLDCIQAVSPLQLGGQGLVLRVCRS
jgi:hypothetical protein